MKTIRHDVVTDLASITGKETMLTTEQRRAIIAFLVERHGQPKHIASHDPQLELELVKKSDAYLAARLVAARDDSTYTRRDDLPDHGTRVIPKDLVSADRPRIYAMGGYNLDMARPNPTREEQVAAELAYHRGVNNLTGRHDSGLDKAGVTEADEAAAYARSVANLNASRR